MASPDSRRSPPSLEDLSTRGATALLLPWILSMATSSDSNSSPRDVVVFVHQPTRSITLVEGSGDVESIIREFQSKEGPSPASKASIESLPVVPITEPSLECAICLTEYEVNGEERVKEMPCRHKFHADCIERWLGIHGTCPMCRFVMPAVAAAEKKEVEESGGWRIHVYFARAAMGSDVDTDAGYAEGDLDGGNDEDTDMENIN